MAARPTIIVELGLATTPVDTATWIDVSGFVIEEGLTIRRGRTDEFTQIQAGSATVVLLNTDRRFDPTYTAGPHYPQLLPMQRIRISAIWTGVTYVLFTGYITTYQPSLTGFNRATMTLTATDAAGALLAKTNVGGEIYAYNLPLPSGLNGSVSPTQVYYLGSGLQNYQQNYGNTRFRINSNSSVTGGTFTLTFQGQPTAPIAYNAYGSDIKRALEALPNIGPNNISWFSGGANLPANSQQIDFGGVFAHQSVPVCTIDTTNLIGSTYSIVSLGIGSAGGSPANYFASPNGRKIRYSLIGTLSSSVSYSVSVQGIKPDGSFISGGGSGALASGVANPSSLTSFAFGTVQNVIVSAYPAIDPSDIGKLLTITIDGSFASQNSGSAINAVLDAIGWPTADRSIDTGKSTIQAFDATGDAAISIIQQIAQSENGLFFISKDGKAVFQNRHTRIVSTSLTTFGDGGSTELPYEDIDLDYGDKYLYNDIRVTREGGVQQIAQDVVSVGRYFRRSLTPQSLQVTSDSEALSTAQWLLALYKDPAIRVSSIKFRGELSDTALWPILLNGEISNRYTVKNRPPGGGVIQQDVYLEAINISIRRNDWQINWSLSPAISGYWVLGVSKLGVDTRLAY